MGMIQFNNSWNNYSFRFSDVLFIEEFSLK